jgi:acyl-CoA synthetase (AMP-forming)/AMP-acid ligase II
MNPYETDLDRNPANFQPLTPLTYLERAARVFPAQTAIIHGDARTSYAELWRRSLKLASALAARGIGKGDTVSVMLSNTPPMLEAHFGVPMVKAVLHSLNTRLDAAIIAFQLDHADSKILVVDREFSSVVAEALKLTKVKPLVVDYDDPEYPDDAPYPKSARIGELDYEALISAGGENFAWSMPDDEWDSISLNYTSGTTGNPKGVVNTHANDIHFIEWAVKYFGIDAGDRISCHPPLHFDMSGFDIYSSVSAGAELHPVPPEINVFPKFVAEFIRKRKLTQWFSVPSVLTLMANMDVVKVKDFPEMKRLVWCGEVMPTSTLVYLMKRLQDVRFTNLYGPTETTIASSYYTVEECPADETADIPIGTACDGEQLHVLDENMRPVKPGVIANLYISGKGVGAGYWEEPEKTEAAFLPNPFSDIPDDLIYPYFELVTDVSVEELKFLKEKIKTDPRNSKHHLAFTITRMYHGKGAAEGARKHFEQTVINKDIPDDAPEIEYEAGSTHRILDIIAEAKLTSSNGETKRMIKQGGVTIDDEKVTDPNFELTFKAGQDLGLKVGKRKFAKLKS